MKIKKRNGNFVEFQKEKVINAVYKASIEVDPATPMSFAESVADIIEEQCKSHSEVESHISVETIQDLIEDELLNRDKQIAKKYIIYRDTKNKKRKNRKKYNLLSEEFLSKYKHREDPLDNVGRFVFYRTYSRFLPEEGRRELWWESIARAVDYNCSLTPNTTVEEAEKLYDNIYNKKQQLSGRTLYTGGTKASMLYPMSNFNCSFTVIRTIHDFCDLFYILMVGTGAGISVQARYAGELPPFRTDVKLFHEEWEFTEKSLREEVTTTEVNGDTIRIIIGDSKEGFVESLRVFLSILTSNAYRTIKNVIVNYNYVRPKGERLETFGGTASGHINMKNMLHKIHKVITARRNEEDTPVYLERIDVLDTCNIIGQNVISGGVRRTAELGQLDSDDEVSKAAKSNIYYKDENGNWVENANLTHRMVSNNSVVYYERPTREELHQHLEIMRYSGEPGIINAEAAMKRRHNFKGLNPCAEILLDSYGVCNLTTTNILAFVRPDRTLDLEELLKATRLSVRAGYRMTTLTLELPHWDRIHKRDRLLGVSMTGYQDAVSLMGYNMESQRKLLRTIRQEAHDAMKEIAKELGLPESILVTTVKPEGTISWVMGGVSSGAHRQHAPFFIRRIRVSAQDAMVKVAKELGWIIYPEVGETMENANTVVIEFPIKSNAKQFKKDVSAIEQLETYKMLNTEYTDHNTSITIDIYDHEWPEAEEWIWNNWDEFVGLSFLSRSDKFYELMPYEEITEEEYEKRVAEMKPFNPILLRKYETSGVSELDAAESCAEGACAVR